jgi:hypothetical protein
MTLLALPSISRAPCGLVRQLRKRREIGPCQNPPEVVLTVLHQSTVWFTHHPRDSRIDLRSSREIVSNFSSSSHSSTVRLSLHSSRGQLGRHSRSHQWGTRATTMGRLGTSLRNALYQGRPTHLVLWHQWPTSRRASRGAQHSDLVVPTTLPRRRYPRERKSLWVRSFSTSTPSLYCLILGLRMIS